MARIPRYVAVHEAGHAVATWYVGQYIDTAAVTGAPRLDSSFYVQPVMLRLMLDTPDVAAHLSMADIAADIERDVVSILAGPLAEARARKVSGMLVMLTGGHDDSRMIRARLDLLPADDRRAVNRNADTLTRRLLRRYRPTVDLLADRLLAAGTLEGEEVHELISGATSEPAYRGFRCPLN